MWLVAVDTTQIQPYIFGSNRLRENIGASCLVDIATRDWAFEAVTKAVGAGGMPGKTNIGAGNKLIDDGADRTKAPHARIEDGLGAEVLYAGGGNFVVLFEREEQAKDFQSLLSRRALLEAPGLQLVIGQQEVVWQRDVLSRKLDEVFRGLADRKRNRAWSAPLLGLGVTAACRSTGLAATGIVPGIRGEPGYLASDEIRAKVDVATKQGGRSSVADQRLRKALKLPGGYSFPADFEDMGATPGEYSHIAIVHADGNGMGQCMRDIGKKCTTADKKYTTAEENRAYILELRAFSLKVEEAAEQALQVVLDDLMGAIYKGKGRSIVYEPNQYLSLQIDLKSTKDDGYYVPFRPIVFGGDDVTFVCDGRLGLSLAIAYLREFERQTERAKLGENGGGLTGCAGIAIVKSHYPFARAYALAGELTRKAKTYRSQNEIAGSCLDWHFALSGLGGSIEEIREREYQVHEGSLTLRPVTLGSNPREDLHAWEVVQAGIRAFQQEEWVGRRNKLKALRDALREGPGAVEHFRESFNNGEPLPLVLPGSQDYSRRGWHKACVYFDAIELADWFIPLEGEIDERLATAPAPGK